MTHEPPESLKRKGMPSSGANTLVVFKLPRPHRHRVLQRCRKRTAYTTQVPELQKMIEEDRYCADILTQLSSVHEALRGVARELMRNHLKHCAATAIRSSDAEAEAMYDELGGAHVQAQPVNPMREPASGTVRGVARRGVRSALFETRDGVAP